MTRVADLAPLEKIVIQRVSVAPWPLRPDDHMAKEVGLACLHMAKRGLVTTQRADGAMIIEITEKGARLAEKIGKK